MEGCILGKTLLVVSGGIEAVPGIKRAKDMGLYVVVSDGNPNAPGFEYADDYIISSTYDVAKTAGAAEEFHNKIRPIDGVMCVASDVPLTVATVAKKLDLPGIPLETARLSMDKLAMKECFAQQGIPIPWFKKVLSINDLFNIINERGLPLVVKPVDSRGARGVLRITNESQVEWAFEHSLQYSPSKRLMAEELLKGPQISTEAIIIDGIGYPIGFTDRNYEFLERFSPYIIENGGQFPSQLCYNDQASISNLAIKAGLSLGVNTGIVKGDMVLTEQGPMVIEIAPRLSGGWFSTDQIPIGLGVDLVGSAIKLALGEKIDVNDLTPKLKKGVAIRYFFPAPGVVKDITNIGKYQDIEWVHKIGFFVKPGDIIEKITNHTQRAGFVITIGETGEQAVERALQVVETIHIETVPQ